MEWIRLYDQPVEAIPIPGVVHRTRPRVTQATDDRSYFLKGPDSQTVIAEALGYEFAQMVGLSVPRAALCRIPGRSEIWFASEDAGIRSGVERLLFAPVAANPELLGACVAFDIWTVNRDRNMGNIVAQPLGGGRVRLQAIDFEQAEILCGTDRFTIGTIDAAACLPRGALADCCIGMAFPEATCDVINQVQRDAIADVVDRLAVDLGNDIEWKPRAVDLLEHRARSIRDLVRGALNG
jgi:hypothetical protein